MDFNLTAYQQPALDFLLGGDHKRGIDLIGRRPERDRPQAGDIAAQQLGLAVNGQAITLIVLQLMLKVFLPALSCSKLFWLSALQTIPAFSISTSFEDLKP